MTERKSHAPVYVSLGLLLLVVGLYWIWPAYREFVNEGMTALTSDDNDQIKAWVSQFGFWGPLIIIAAMVAQMFLLVLPSWGLMIVAVLAYGPVLGSVISILAVLAASTVGYIIGRFLSESALERFLGAKTLEKVEDQVCAYGFWFVVIVRLAPFLSNDAISLIAGLVRMGYMRFMIATFVGIAPLAAAIGYFGRDTSSLKSGLIWISAIALVGLALKVIWDKKHGKEKSPRRSKVNHFRATRDKHEKQPL